jgi:alkylated DNA repair dioxygenase AlkB
MANPELDFYATFFSQKESFDFLNALSKEIQWGQKSIRLFGRSILEPRLTAWYGDPSAVYAYSGVTMAPHPWIPTLIKIKSRIETACKTPFNSVLLNLYRNHRDSMGMHSDDEKELGPQPIIASVSFGDARRFVMKQKTQKNSPSKTFWLSSGSLLIMRGETQKLWKHGIPKESQICGPRINLTFRTILTPSEKNPLKHSPGKV